MATKKSTTSDAKNKEQERSLPTITARIDRLVDQEDSSIKAFASVNVAGAVAIHGIKVIDSAKGLFVSMPQSSYKKDGQTQYSDICHPITAEARNELIDKVTAAYEEQLAIQEAEPQEMADIEDEDQAIEHQM